MSSYAKLFFLSNAIYFQKKMEYKKYINVFHGRIYIARLRHSFAAYWMSHGQGCDPHPVLVTISYGSERASPCTHGAFYFANTHSRIPIQNRPKADRVGPIVISAQRVKGRCSARRTGWLLSRSHTHLPGDLVRLRIEKQHVARRTKTPGKSDEYSWDAGIILYVTRTHCLIGHDKLERDPRQSSNTCITMSSNNRYGATGGSRVNR